MSNLLKFNPDKYEVKRCEIDSDMIQYYAFENVQYCSNPVDEIQKLNIFVPADYYEGKTINGYDLHTAPILIYNTTSGYRPGEAGHPEKDFFGIKNGIFQAIKHGYVAVSAGTRGSLSEQDGTFVGKAPAFIVDLKAAIRFLRYNQSQIPGDTERIITLGTSAAGALSALAGATGNSTDYQSYLEKIGAAYARDDIFAACCYCPVHNLENADAAYEWCFNNHYTWYKPIYDFGEEGLKGIHTENVELPKEQMELSKILNQKFVAYVNELHLKDERDMELTLDAHGNGSFKDYVLGLITKSAQKEYDTHHLENTYPNLMEVMPCDSKIDQQTCIQIDDDGKVTVDWDAFVESIMRSKDIPCTDSIKNDTCENLEFGDETGENRHFTEFSFERSLVNGKMAPENIIKMMNPTRYIGNADTAKNWWVRHSTHDSAVSVAVPVILATMLKNQGCNVDFEFPWGLPHCGDYDMDDMFEWIDQLCQ